MDGSVDVVTGNSGIDRRPVPVSLVQAFAAGMQMALQIVLSWRQSAPAQRVTTEIGVGPFAYFTDPPALMATTELTVSNALALYFGARARAVRWGNEHSAEKSVYQR
jgi:hypothetical protein